MSYDEQKAATTSVIQELQEVRETKTLAKRNVALSAFHDTKKTLESIENQVRWLHSCLLLLPTILPNVSRLWLYMHVPPLKSPSLPFAATRIIIIPLTYSYLVPGSRNSSTSASARHCLILRFVLRLFAYLVSKVFITAWLILCLSFQCFSIGVARNYVQNTLDMKKNLAIVIVDKLREF